VSAVSIAALPGSTAAAAEELVAKAVTEAVAGAAAAAAAARVAKASILAAKEAAAVAAAAAEVAKEGAAEGKEDHLTMVGPEVLSSRSMKPRALALSSRTEKGRTSSCTSRSCLGNTRRAEARTCSLATGWYMTSRWTRSREKLPPRICRWKVHTAAEVAAVEAEKAAESDRKVEQ